MKYSELTLDQRITLKGFFQTDKELSCYWAIMIFWDFVKAVEYFLNNDINILTTAPHSSLQE